MSTRLGAEPTLPIIPGKAPKRGGRSPARSQVPVPNGKVVAKQNSYASEGVTNNDIFSLPSSDWQLLGVLTVVAAVVRLFRIYQPSSVVFDEVHFGGFASKYIKGKFFMDVHPPLAKMLIALVGWLGGFDGEFDFKDIGKDYLEPGVPYVTMRMFPALCGVATIPTMFLTLKAYGCRTTTAALGAALVIFENGLVANNRLILLDSPLIAATAFTSLTWTSFMNQHEQGPSKAFTPSWWFWLVSTGLWLGATVSMKWVGLFTIAWVGSLTALQLWVLLGDTTYVTPRLWFKHFFARVFCLIIIPVTFYMGMFAIHFVCLSNSGEGDGFMSSEFQATLNSKAMEAVPADVEFGSRVSLRHHNTQGGYLHSHAHMYPEGSKQQQITLYPHKDENNVWLLENQTQPINAANETISGFLAWDQLPTNHIMDGDVIKLYHLITNRRLHSHDQRPPVTEADWQQEVSAYGYEGFEGDANDMFRVEIIKSMSDGVEAKQRLRTIQTKFKLVHIMTGCVLFSHKVKLPEWGFEQQEVTCAKGGTLPNSVWYIEQNEHPQLGATAEMTNYRNPGFLGKFWELNKVMWTTNAGLTDSHAWDSRPPSWPILKRGINFWGKDHRQIYLMGNPVIWLSSTVAIALWVVFKGLAVLRWQRGFKDYSNPVFKRFDYDIGMTVLGWAFHYFPFFLMARQLFLHHYFPALYFAIMAIAQIYDFVCYRVGGIGLKSRPAIGQAIAIAFIAISITAFTMYAPLAYGNTWTKGACEKVKLLDTWDWDCNTFFDTYEEYNSYTPTVGEVVATSAAQVPVVQVPVEAPPMSAPADAANVTPLVDEQGYQILSKEEKVEYRDENGNVLDDAQVEALRGQVEFSTRYETRTRLVDGAGNEIYNKVVEGAPNGHIPGPGNDNSYVADKPDPEPETVPAAPAPGASDIPAHVDIGDDLAKEEHVQAVDTAASAAVPEQDPEVVETA